MAYTIDRYNNSQLTVVEDGTIDQTTDLKLLVRIMPIRRNTE